MGRARSTTPRIAAVVDGLLARRADLAGELAVAIRTDVPFYARDTTVDLAALTAVADSLLGAVLQRFVDDRPFDLTVPQRVGRERAAAGVPLTAIMDAYRVGAAFIWNVIADAVVESGVPADDLIAVTAQLWEGQGAFTHALAESYRAETTARLLTEQAERAALVDALLTGRVLTQTTLWEIAELLRLPAHGPFVVVCADPPTLGRVALPAVEARLGGAGVASAWQLLPDLEVGIVPVADRAHRRSLVGLLASYPDRRIGISPEFAELNGTGEALRLARVALETTDDGGGVTAFDDVPLAAAAVSSPDVMRRIAATVLASLESMREEDRAILLDTFEAWTGHGGSADAAGRVLFCHPNTVRQRLKRLEERTGRSLSDPRQLAELCLAVEAHRRLPPR